jgi:hypothetical protein
MQLVKKAVLAIHPVSENHRQFCSFSQKKDYLTAYNKIEGVWTVFQLPPYSEHFVEPLGIFTQKKCLACPSSKIGDDKENHGLCKVTIITLFLRQIIVHRKESVRIGYLPGNL